MPMVGVPEMYGPAPTAFNTEPAPPSGEQFAASFDQNSIIVSAARALALQGWEPQEGYKASWDDIKDNPHYADRAPEFAAAVSPAHFDAIKTGIDRDVEERRIQAASGTAGTLGSLLSQVDPTMLLPGRVAVGVFKTGMPFARGALEVGAAAGLQAAAQASVMRAGQQDRTLGEGLASVGSATVLGGFLGGAAAFISPAERAIIAGKMDRERAVNDAHVAGAPPPATASVGAEAVGKTMEDLTVVPTGIGAEKLGDNAVTRSLHKESLEVRRRATELAETAVLVKGNIPKQVIDTEVVLDAKGEPVLNAEGKPVVKVTPRVDAEGNPVMTVGTTTPGGVAPIETIVRTQQNTTESSIIRDLEQAWTESNFAGEAPRLAKYRDQMVVGGVDFSGLGTRTTFEEFSKQVGDAVMFGVKHENPHVQAVAEKIKPIFDKWAGKAEAAIPGFKRAAEIEGESYFPHVWNKVMIQSRRPEFVNRLVEKFSGDQSANALTQGRIRSHQEGLEQHEANIKKYDRQLEKKQADLADDELLQEEVRRQNKFGYQTAERLRESSYENVGGIRVEAPEKNIGKAQGGTLFETEIRKRGNTLADRASAHRAEIADLEEKLQAEHASAAEMRARIEEEIANWHGQSTAEAKSAIKAREKYEAEREAKRAAGEPKGGRLTSADEAIDKAVQRILESPTDRTAEDLRAKAQQTVDHIIGSPDGRLPFDEAATGSMPKFTGEPPVRGSLAERALDVSNQWAHDWIERDIHKVMKNYMRTFMPDVLLAERYGGDFEMKAEMRAIEDEYARLIDAVPPGAKGEKEALRLSKERNDAIADIAMLRDRIRGLFQIPTNASERSIGRISAAARNFAHITSMGMAAVASIPDTAGVIFRWGMNSVFKDAWAPLLKSFMTADRTFAKEAYRQFEVMGIINETLLNTRHHSFHGMTEPYAQGSLAERTLQKGADTMQLLNLMAPQSDLMKVIASTVAATGIYRAARRAADGKATKLDLLQLGQANIPSHMYERIAEQYEKSHTDINGHKLPNTEKWTDMEARGHFEAAIHRDVNLSVVTPGIDKPAFISHPVLGVLTQFKSFTAAATTRILVANLQRADAHTLQGLIASLGFGAMAYFVHSVVSGNPLSDKPSDWAKESISRGNLLGWLDEANTLASKMTRGKADVYRVIGADKPLSRDAGRTAVENLLGPTVGKMSNLTRVTGAMASGEVNAGDIHAVRRLTGYQNLWFLNRALTAVEKSTGNSMGIKQPEPKH